MDAIIVFHIYIYIKLYILEAIEFWLMFFFCVWPITRVPSLILKFCPYPYYKSTSACNKSYL